MPYLNGNPHEEDCTLEPVAICGMACRLPGAVDSASSLWELLVKKGSGQTPRVPKSRFNIDAHYHENLERPGSFNVLGGYFLDGPLENFDPTFFNITPIEAMWMDPQQRKMLEVSYECLESAGLSLDAVAGSNTAVFVGSFTSDYQQMSIRDTDFRHNYAATGVDPGIISNRIGNTFNLRGPSFTINTACSSSIYAIHNACHALRAGDCDAAIAGGVNLILTVDQHMNTAKLGILSPTSTCHTFDASADGYGRAEGAGALYLKRLSDAIRDGDMVRGVIRSSAVNTNGKVAGMGITHPSVEGQERVMRAAYEKANLDPVKTAYVENHGTGTPVGDPIEARAVSNAMSDTRSKAKPLLIGAIKANIGHSEAASGIFAVMKAAMMTETGVIPGVAGFKSLNPAIDEKGWNLKVQADTVPWPKDYATRRAGVSSFGYGGTNGHVIVEEVTSLYPWYQHGKAKSEAPYSHSSTRPFLIGFSAHDKVTLSKNIVAHAKVANKFYLADLAHTLNLRRTKFSQRAFVIARQGRETEDFAPTSVRYGAASKKAPRLGFMFTGQGAQWPGMGAEAMQTFPSFLSTIRNLDQVLQRLDFPPSWSIEEALLSPAETTRVGDAEISQPVCTAIQIAIVDLFAQWEITPAVTVGHSSGEIGAAYAAGLLSAPEAIIAAFYRGFAVKHNTRSGTMLAAGVGVQDVSKYVSDFGKDVVVACENSPSSVTLSGTFAAIKEAKERLEADGIFAKELRTGKAYHSPQMSAVAPIYNDLLSRASQKLDQQSLEWRQPPSRMISSVTGEEFSGEHVPVEYWSKNLRSRVLFDSAITTLGKTPGLEDVRCMIEIGPHSALAGPFKQICIANGYDRFTYIPTFIRNSDSSLQLLKTAGELFVLDYPLDLEELNTTEDLGMSADSKKLQRPLTLVDLPPYQWNYEKRYWAEPRFSQEQRNIKHLRHDLLGSKLGGLSDRSLVWRNMICHKNVPWLQDHKLGNVTVFPAAGYLSLAIEALRQVCDIDEIHIYGVTVRDMAIKTTLVIPDTDDGVEVQLRLQQTPKSDGNTFWYSFAAESLSEGRWTLHCEGSIVPNTKPQNLTVEASSPVDLSKLTQRVPGKRWYDAFNRVGFEYGPSFQQLNHIKTDSKYHDAAADVKIATDSGLMKGESRYILHPSTIDACLQLIIVSINAGLHKEMSCGVVPIEIEEATLWFPGDEAGSSGRAVAWTDEHDGRYFNTHTKLTTESGNLVLDVKSLRCVAYEAAVPQQAQKQRTREPYMKISWKPDISCLSTSLATQAYPELRSESDSIAKIVELLNHKSPLASIFLLGQHSAKNLDAILKCTPSTISVTLGESSSERLENPVVISDHRISTVLMTEGTSDWDEFMNKPQDLVIVAKTFMQASTKNMLLPIVKSIVNKQGKVVFSIDGDSADSFAEKLISSGFSGSELRFDHSDTTIILSSPTAHYNGLIYAKEEISLVSLKQQAPLIQDLSKVFADSGSTLKIEDIKTFDISKDKKVIIYDIEGTLLSLLDLETFDALKTILCSGATIVWLSAGVQEGKSVFGAMSQGFLRAIRSEQAMAKITLLDVDTDETVGSIVDAILSHVGTTATKDSGADTEFWLHNGITQVNRVIPSNVLNDQFSASLEPAEEALLPAGKAYRGKAAGGELLFLPNSLREQSELGAYEVDIQVESSEFEKSDLQTRTESPRIVAGKILKVGNCLDPSLVGQDTVAYTTEAYSTIIRLPRDLCTLFTHLEATDLVATLPNLCKAVNAILDTAKVHETEHVLLLDAPLTIVRAFTSLGGVLGIKFTIVVESEKDKQDCIAKFKLTPEAVMLTSDVKAICALVSKNRDGGPTAVIAHDFSYLSQEVWRFMPPMSRFILNEGVIREAPDALPFKRGASFLSTSIATLYKRDANLLGYLLQRTLGFLKEHNDAMTQKPAVYDISSPQPTATTPNDNCVVTYNYGRSSVKIQPSGNELRLSPNATYLLVGCLGGIGRSLITWMMEKGAKHFAFISRSGADKPEAAQLIKSITKAGASSQVFRADASNEQDVISVVSEISAMRPIHGVVHAAMVLEDAIFERMTFDQFTAAVIPKVKGAQNLHNALRGHSLDFFVMTSSISATLGNPGQSNYCAANSFLDALAWHRNLNGLAASSLILPMILDVGVVAENENIEIALSRKGMYGIDEREMLRGFETAMTQPAPQNSSHSPSISTAQIILGLEPALLSTAISSKDTADVYWYNDARFHGLRMAVEDAGKDSNSTRGSGGDFMALLADAQAQGGPDAAIQVIATHIMKKCSSILMTPMEVFELEGQSIAEYGLDSMIGAELRNWLFKEFGLDIPFQELLAPTLMFKGLSIRVAEALGAVEGEGEGRQGDA